MVLEALMNPLDAEKHPRRAFFYGFLYASVAVFLSIWIFKQHASLVLVFLTTLSSVPLVYNTIRLEEKKDETIVEEKTLLTEHMKALSLFIFLFVGFVIAYSFWYVVLPPDIASSTFSIQSETISRINGRLTGNTHLQFASFFSILMNNLGVLLFSVLFAFVFGFGAIFILSWNASVIGVAIGNFIRGEIAKVAVETGFVKIGNYFSIVSLGLAKYVIHGIPEILAYFTAGLGASIISVALMRRHLNPDKFKRILLDSSDLILLSVVLIIIAAFLEVFFTPLFFS